MGPGWCLGQGLVPPPSPPGYLEDLLDGVHELGPHAVAGQHGDLEGALRLGILRLRESKAQSDLLHPRAGSNCREVTGKGEEKPHPQHSF